MNTEINHNNGAGNGIAFLFGAVFNLLANVNLSFFFEYALQALAGGIVCLVFKIIGDILSPLWQKHKNKVQDFARLRGISSMKLKKKKSRQESKDHDQE